jgi:predicted ATP-grasp superfamily ATP-dependent carboligase
LSKLAHKTLLVIALCSRPFVTAAHSAGFNVAAIDGFADRETRALAQQVSVVAFNERGFAADALMTAVHMLDPADYMGFIYGAGFEAQPELLQAIAKIIPLIGNDPAAISRLKSVQFFSTLTDLDIPHPRTFLQSEKENVTSRHLNPPIAQKIVRKLIGGSGGTHIQYDDLPSSGQVSDEHYHQELIAGTPVSLLFIAHERRIEIIGFNEQWLSPSVAMPFRYGGAVNHIALSAAVKQQLIRAAAQLTIEYDLKGLNSLDAILRQEKACMQEQVYVLELNPRLSASFDLYSDKVTHLMRHIDACQYVSLQVLSEVEEPVNRAHAIVYAATGIFIPEDFDWPEWATDTPSQLNGNRFYIAADAPICTVLALSNSSHEAKRLAISRVKMMHELLLAFHDKQQSPARAY